MQKPVATWDGQRDCWIAEPYPLGQRRKIGLYEHWGVYSGTFPNQGTMRNGQLYPQPRRVPRTYESESSSLLPTVTTQDGANNGGPAQQRRNTPPLNVVAPQLLPSPVANPSGNTAENHLRKKPGRTQVTDLRIIVEEDLLPTGGKIPAQPSEGLSLGPYETSLRRWEMITGMPMPHPTETNRNGKQVLSGDFCEWLMGLPKNHIKGTRNERIRQAGNGVVVPQAELALRRMMEK